MASSSADFLPGQHKTLSFLRLPSEIRNAIYRAVLLLPEPIELYPNLGVGSVEHLNSLVSKLPDYESFTSSKLIDALKRREGSLKVHEFFLLQKDLLHISTDLAVGLLRTCRQIRDEALDIFYGDNSWKFSYDKDWHHLNRFLLTIGPRARSRIRDLTVWAPFARDPIEGHGLAINFDRPENHPKLHVVKVPDCHEGLLDCRCQRSVYEMLMQDKTLERIRFVVPGSYMVYDLDGSKTIPNDFSPKITVEFLPGAYVSKEMNVEVFTSRGVSLSSFHEDELERT